MWGDVTKNGVKFKFKGKKSGIVVVKKIDLPGTPGISCTKEFEDTSLESGMKFGETKEFYVECDIGRDSVDTPIDVYVTYYSKEGLKIRRI